MRYFYLFIFICIQQLVISQDYEFIGFLKNEQIGIVSFRLNFNITKGDSIEGVSVYDFNGKQRTSSKIRGLLNLKKGILSFQEYDNLASRLNLSGEEFCFINAENLKFKKSKSNTIVSGLFLSYYRDGSLCLKGEIYLVSSDVLDVVNENLSKYEEDTLVTLSKEVVSNTISAVKADEINLFANDTYSMRVTGDSIAIEIWDSYKEDKDQINVFFENKLILIGYEVVNERKMIIIDVSNGGRLVIEALNEGEAPYNTVSFLTSETEKSTRINTKLKTGEKVTLILNK